MGTNPIATGVQQLTPLQLLEKVDLFYNAAWGKLVLYVTILIIFTGVLFPILLAWIQKMSFAVEEDKIKIGLKEYCDKLTEEIKRDITLKFNEQQQIVDKKFIGLERKLNEKIAGSHGAMFYIQGNFLFSQGVFLTALESYIDAIDKLVEANDHRNLGTALETLKTLCIPKIYAEDLENLEYDGYSLDKTIQLLNKYNTDSIYTNDIVDLKKAIHAAKQRRRGPDIEK